MALTSQQVADALTAAGIDTTEKLAAFLRPAAIATEVRKLQGQIEKLEADHLAAKTQAQADHNAAVTELRETIETLNATLRQ